MFSVPAAIRRGIVPYEALNSVLRDTGGLTLSIPSSNRKTWTFSCWTKNSEFVTREVLFGLYSNDNISLSSDGKLSFNKDAFPYPSDTVRESVDVIATNLEWIHIVVALDTTQANEPDRLVMYANGVELETTTLQEIPKDSEWGFNLSQHNLFTDTELKNYNANVCFIDGRALPASRFGGFIDGKWVARDLSKLGYSGINSFWLPFDDELDIGKDVSGNANHFTDNGVIVTKDTPDNNGVIFDFSRAETAYDIHNGARSVQYTNTTSNVESNAVATKPVTSGKWYWEYRYDIHNNNATATMYVGACKNTIQKGDDFRDPQHQAFGYSNAGWLIVDGTFDGTTQHPLNQGDIVGCLMDLDARTFQFQRNGSDVYDKMTMSSTEEYVAAVTMRRGDVQTTLRTLKEDFTFPVPAGYLPLGGKP